MIGGVEPKICVLVPLHHYIIFWDSLPFQIFSCYKWKFLVIFLFVWVYTRNTIGGAEPDVHCGYLVR